MFSLTINPFFSKILLKAIPKGKAFADKDKYLYADLSLETNEPTMGRK